jgi:hypothetical protein
VGDGQSNDIRGLQGDDTITGKEAGDLIFGGIGIDRIIGDDGNDDYDTAQELLTLMDQEILSIVEPVTIERLLM